MTNEGSSFMACSIDSTLVRQTVEKLRPRAGAIEEARCVPDDVVEDLRACGFFRALVPARYGGLESCLLPLWESLSEVGEACCSTAWVTSLFASHSLIAAWFPVAAQDALWKDEPDTLIGSSLAPMGRLTPAAGGFKLSGEWSFSSGIDHAEWLLLGARDADARSYLVLVRANSASLTDDWQVCGLQGTGSKSLALEDYPVGEEFLLSMESLENGETPGHQLNPHAPFHFPWRPAFSFSFVPPALGAARSALSFSRSYLRERRSAYTGKKYAENPIGWVRLAESASEIETALTLLRRDVEAIESELARSRPVDRAVVDRSCYTPALIVKLCRQAVTRLFHMSAGQALYRDNALQRNFRDIQAIGQHPGVNIDIAGQTYGRSLLDGER